MKISTKGRYAIRMLLDLAKQKDGGYTALKDIAERQGISKKYLEQIIPFLNRSNLLIANRGHMGGYQLSRQPSQITIFEILVSAEGSLCPVSCMDNEPNVCPRANECITLPLWQGLYKKVYEYLNGVTLQDLIDNKTEYGDYCI